MRILVTGGAGFIGSHVVDTFVTAGHDVAVVDNLWEHGGGRRDNINQRSHFFHRDIRDVDVASVFNAFKPEIVAHFAAQHSVAVSTKNPRYDADVNVSGLLNILELSARHGVRKVIFASSSATYGTPKYLPIDEAHPQNPESPYGISKMVAEHYLRYFAESGGPAFTALRFGNVYGPRQDPSGEAGVIAIFASRILSGQPIRVDWDGEQQKDYVYVGDVAHAAALSLQAGDGQCINIGTGVGTSVNVLHRAIAGVVGRDVEVEHAPKRTGDIRTCIFAIEKAKSVLGWQPQVDLASGIANTVEFFRAKEAAS